MQKSHPANIYNEKRRIIFSQADKNLNEAQKWLDGYKQILGTKGYKGLSAELEFYAKYGKDYHLTPALDCGDSTDFSAVIDGNAFRIDVTTNLNFKELEKYEPYQTNGKQYKIALYTGDNFELIDINFPFCSNCGYGRIFNIALLHGQNFKNEEPTWTNDQSLIDVCGSCGHYQIISNITSHCFPDFSEIASDLWDHLGLNEIYESEEPEEYKELRNKYDQSIHEYSVTSIRYLKEQFSTFLVGIGSPGYKITGHRGEGHYIVKPSYIENLVSGRFLDEFEFNFYDLPRGTRTE